MVHGKNTNLIGTQANFALLNGFPGVGKWAITKALYESLVFSSPHNAKAIVDSQSITDLVVKLAELFLPFALTSFEPPASPLLFLLALSFG
jgi:hypothetical protein